MGVKVANIRLKPGKEPITVSGKAYASGKPDAMRFPTVERQQNGWYSQEAKRIVTEYKDRYELIAPGGANLGGGN